MTIYCISYARTPPAAAIILRRYAEGSASKYAEGSLSIDVHALGYAQALSIVCMYVCTYVCMQVRMCLYSADPYSGSLTQANMVPSEGAVDSEANICMRILEKNSTARQHRLGGDSPDCMYVLLRIQLLSESFVIKERGTNLDEGLGR